MKIWLVSVLITVVSSTTVFAENFAFLGFDFEQTPDEQQRILKTQGIECQDEKGLAFEGFDCKVENALIFRRIYLEKRKAREIFIRCEFVNICGQDADKISEFTQKNLGFSNYSVSTETTEWSYVNCYHFSETQKLCSHFYTPVNRPTYVVFSLLQEEFTKNGDKKDAKPITFFAINYAQTTQEQMEALSEQGAECKSWEVVAEGRYNCEMRGGDIMSLGSMISFKCQVFNGCRYSMEEVIDSIKQSVLQGDETQWSATDNFKRDLRCFRGPLGDSLCVVSPQPGDDDSTVEVQLRYDRYERPKMVFN